jgi:hypothetical protein
VQDNRKEPFALIFRHGEGVRPADVAKGCGFETACTNYVMELLGTYTSDIKVILDKYISVRRGNTQRTKVCA